MSTLLFLQFTTDNKIFIKSILEFDIYILKRKSDWLIEASRRPVQNSYVCKLWYTDRKKLSHFDIKNWVTCGIKVRPGKVGNWRIFESNWLNIKSLIDSTLRVLMPGWHSGKSAVSVVCWLMHCRFAPNQGLTSLCCLSQVESTLRFKLTQLWEFNWLKYSPVTHLAGRIIILPVTQLLRSKLLNPQKKWVILT